MTEQDFLSKWEHEKDMYLAWGELVIKVIIDGINSGNSPSFNALNVSQDIKDKILSKIKIDDYEIIRNMPTARLKDNHSLLQKAFYRKKEYSDPYNDITDKVGCRFVVLYSEQIPEIETVIKHYPFWIFSKDVDYRESRRERGSEFGYQSVHYTVRAKNDMPYKFADKQVIIKKGTPCEVQIRTLLQHAYSEVSHDTFYKNSLVDEPATSRIAMMSVISFIDAAEDNFKKVLNDYIQHSSPKKTINSKLILDYWNNIGIETIEQCNINDTLVGVFSNYLDDNWEANFKLFCKENIAFNECIKYHAQEFMLFRQPAILLVYYLATSNKDIVVDKWPFSHDLLTIIMNDIDANKEK